MITMTDVKIGISLKQTFHQGMKMICGKKATGDMVQKERPFHRCTYLHHSNPYLKLGPFKIEKFMSSPLRLIFHDILSEREMDFLIEYSTPRLSNARYYEFDISSGP